MVLDRLNLIKSTVQATTSSFWYELHCDEQLSEASRTGSESVVQFVLMVTAEDYSIMHIGVFYPSKTTSLHTSLHFLFLRCTSRPKSLLFFSDALMQGTMIISRT